VTFTLDRVVPWGRSFDEYQRMFALTPADLARHILGCGDGPAAFNADATRGGARVVSCDPIYQWDGSQLEARVTATFDQVLAETRRNADEFVWDDRIDSVDTLGAVRGSAMRTFLDDFESGRAARRYVAGELPDLPFGDGSFDLALCSHLLFLYSTQLGEPFHLAAIRELCRVAGEVRVFPLLALGGRPSPWVEPVAAALRLEGHQATLDPVPYEFQRGGNQMMRIVRRSVPQSPGRPLARSQKPAT
jgi:hypothetical protein